MDRIQRTPSLAEQSSGMFIERALEQVLPSAARFPFALRANVDILAADGSLAEHAVTSCSRALKSTNVPLSREVAGVPQCTFRSPQLEDAPSRFLLHNWQVACYMWLVWQYIG